MYVRNVSKYISRILLFLISGAIILFTACNNTTKTEDSESTMKITPQQAKALMDSEKDYVILDVRTYDEFDEGHIKNAVLIPDFELNDRAEDELTDKNQLIFVYCRSGVRSAGAAYILDTLGYTNVKDIGGIINWPYETVK